MLANGQLQNDRCLEHPGHRLPEPARNSYDRRDIWLDDGIWADLRQSLCCFF